MTGQPAVPSRHSVGWPTPSRTPYGCALSWPRAGNPDRCFGRLTAQAREDQFFPGFGPGPDLRAGGLRGDPAVIVKFQFLV